MSGMKYLLGKKYESESVCAASLLVFVDHIKD